MIIKSLNLSDKSEMRKWDDFVRSHGHLYYDSRWAKILHSVFSFEPLYLYGEEDDAIVSVLPLFCVNKPFGGKEIVSIPHIEAGGLINTGSFKMYLDYLHDHVKANSVRIMQFMESLGDLSANSNEVIIIKDLPPTTDEIIDSVPTKRKRNYMRGSLRHPYELVTGNDSALFSTFYSLYLDKMRDFGTPPHSFRFFSAIRDAFGDTCTIIAVKDPTGEVIGAMLCVGYSHMFNCLTLVVPASHLHNLAGYFIEYHVMAYAVSNGYTSLNRGRSEDKGSNYDYKVSLGGKPYPLHRYKFELTSDGYRCVEERTAKEKLRSLAQIWAKLPPVITDNIGPLIRKWVY
ncbi:MAG: GNAT family N-acetyltransferase [Desulfuromonadales bacterium]